MYVPIRQEMSNILWIKEITWKRRKLAERDDDWRGLGPPPAVRGARIKPTLGNLFAVKNKTILKKLQVSAVQIGRIHYKEMNLILLELN